MRPWNTVLTNNLPRAEKDEFNGPGLSGNLDPEGGLSEQGGELVCQDPISGDSRLHGKGDGMLHVQRIRPSGHDTFVQADRTKVSNITNKLTNQLTNNLILLKKDKRILKKGDRYWNEDILLLKRKRN